MRARLAYQPVVKVEFRRPAPEGEFILERFWHAWRRALVRIALPPRPAIP